MNQATHFSPSTEDAKLARCDAHLRAIEREIKIERKGEMERDSAEVKGS